MQQQPQQQQPQQNNNTKVPAGGGNGTVVNHVFNPQNIEINAGQSVTWFIQQKWVNLIPLHLC